MINFYYFFSMYMYMLSCFMLMFFYNHLLMILISLEFLMVNIFFNLFIIMILIEVNIFYLMFFLVMSVCEGALGLSLIVLIIRFYGNDFMNSLSLMKW